MSADTKHWFQGQPVPGVDQSGIGASKYWSNGQPVPLISAAGGGGVSLSVPLATITLAAQTPAVASGKSVTVPAANVTLAAVAPSVASGASVDVPGVEITIGALAPSINGVTIAPDAANINIEGFAPSITARATAARGGGWLETPKIEKARRSAEKRRRNVWETLERTIEDAYAEASGLPRAEVKAQVSEALAERNPARVEAIVEQLAASKDPEAERIARQVEKQIAELERIANAYNWAVIAAQEEWQRQEEDAITLLLLAA